MAEQQASASSDDAQKADALPPEGGGLAANQVSGTDLGTDEAAQLPPGSKTGSDTRESAGGGGTVRGGADTGSDAMPGQSNAL